MIAPTLRLDGETSLLPCGPQPETAPEMATFFGALLLCCQQQQPLPPVELTPENATTCLVTNTAPPSDQFVWQPSGRPVLPTLEPAPDAAAAMKVADDRGFIGRADGLAVEDQAPIPAAKDALRSDESGSQQSGWAGLVALAPTASATAVAPEAADRAPSAPSLPVAGVTASAHAAQPVQAVGTTAETPSPAAPQTVIVSQRPTVSATGEQFDQSQSESLSAPLRWASPAATDSQTFPAPQATVDGPTFPASTPIAATPTVAAGRGAVPAPPASLNTLPADWNARVQITATKGAGLPDADSVATPATTPVPGYATQEGRVVAANVASGVSPVLPATIAEMDPPQTQPGLPPLPTVDTVSEPATRPATTPEGPTAVAVALPSTDSDAVGQTAPTSSQSQVSTTVAVGLPLAPQGHSRRAVPTVDESVSAPVISQARQTTPTRSSRPSRGSASESTDEVVPASEQGTRLPLSATPVPDAVQARVEPGGRGLLPAAATAQVARAGAALGQAAEQPVTRLRLELAPPLLGEVVVELRHEGLEVTAVATVDRPATAEALRHVQTQVQQVLAEQGVQVGSFSVSCRDGGQSRQHQAPPEPWTAAQAQPERSAEPRPTSHTARPTRDRLRSQLVDMYA